MRRAGHSKGYNARIPHMNSSSFRRWGATFFVLFMLSATASWTADWHGSEQQFASKIAAVTGPGAVSLSFDNRSSLGRGDAEQIRVGLTSELAALGIHIVDAEQAAATVEVTLSEDLQNYVWVAQIQQGTNAPAVVMVSMPRPEGAAPARESAEMSIQKTLLWSQREPILDVALMSGSPHHMVIVDANAVSIYRMQDGRWQQEQSLALVHQRPWPRDLRGRLVLRKDRLFDAYLPGVVCHSTAKPPLSMNCAQTDDPWPLGNADSGLSGFYSATRNFFTGALAPGIGKQKSVPAFYTAAALPRDKYTLWLLTAVDGQLHMLDGVSDQNAGNPGWGSDIAAVHSGCGPGWQVLTTGAEDAGADTIRAYEIADRQPLPVSRTAEFTGSITALWPQADEASAVAVSHDSGTGLYEAYQLTIACGQ